MPMNLDPRNQGPVIEPDPDGKYRPMPRVGLWAGIALAFVWTGYLWNNEPDWWAIIVGAATGLLIASWGIASDDGTTVELFKPKKRVHQWPPKGWFR